MEINNEREQEKIRRRERQEEEKAQKRARRYRPPTAPEAAHMPPSSSINLNRGHRSTHGSSVRIPGSDSLYSDPARDVSDTRARIDTWNSRVEPGSAPAPADNVSFDTSASSQRRARLQKRARSTSTTSRSQPLAHIPDDASVDSRASAQRRSRLQRRNRGYSAGAWAQWSGENLSPLSRRSEDRHVGSVGTSSRLFDDRGSIDQRSTSAQGLLSEHH